MTTRFHSRPLQGLLLSTALTLLPAAAAADSPNVVTTIKPVHSLVAGVMEGVGTPFILIDGAASPHGFALKPSQAFLLEGADAVFWIGHDLETSLEKPLDTLAEDAVHVSLMDAPGVELLGRRTGAAFEKHDHDLDHGSGHDEAKHDDHDDHDHKEAKHDDHDDHDHKEAKHDDHDDHDHKEAKHDVHDDHDHDKHAEGGKDPHIWLNPGNARAMVAEISAQLSKLDPENAATYQKNAARMDTDLKKLSEGISAKLSGLNKVPFIVFHDAYHYFEHEFDVEAAGAITLNPEVPASAKRIAEIKGKITDLNAGCVFAEPQFESKIVEVVLDGTGAQSSTLDPLGARLENGPQLYFELLDNMTASFATCLSGS